MKRNRWGALILLLVLSSTLGVACSGSDESEGGAASAGATQDEAGGENLEQPAALGAADGDGSGSSERSAMDLPSVGPSVIKTADLQIEVAHNSFQDSFQTVIDVAQKRGGFVLSSRTSGDDARTGSVTLRVPVETFASALGEIKELGKVTNERVTGEDVSQEFVDLQARLRNLQTQEAVLLGLMNKANTISGTIRVQNTLSNVQLEVERIRGRLRYLEDQTALSTITVGLREDGVAAAAKDPGTIERAWQVARDTTGAIVSGILIGGAALAPIAIVLLIAFLLFRMVRPRFAREAQP